MDEDWLQTIDSTRGDGLPGRRQRRRRSRRRRLLRLVEPFLLLGTLAGLSTGVVKVVETRVPTRADQRDARRVERAREPARDEVRALAGALDAEWMPTPHAEPWIDPGRPMRPGAFVETDEEEPADHLSIEISSTSNTSAAPPGMLGGDPLSP